MLRSDFGGVPDHEELYQEAWTELLELRARGGELTSVRGLLKTIAWRRARDRLRKMKPDSIDPSSPVLASQADTDPLPDEQAQVRLDAAVLRQIIDRLEPRQAAALKLRFDWHLDSREIQERLGVTPKRLEKIVTEAYKAVAAELGDDGDEPAWARKQRSLLLACEMGLASAAQRERAQRMVDQDATCRAMLREMRTTLRDVAVALPTPVLVERRAPDPLPLFDRLGDALAAAKHRVADVLSRGAGPAEQAGGAALGGGAAVKVAVACLAVGGTTVCVGTGVFDRGVSRDAKPGAQQDARRTASSPRPERTIRVASIVRRPQKKAAAKPKPRREVRKPTTTVPTSSPLARPEPSPAPVASTEFGPGSVGSGPATTAPAAAPSDGGGEFGP